jgi:eukaryotic-like serine/threonine-protein kinase
VPSDPTSLPIIDGKYQLVRKLGEGGMGAVYEARHRGTGRRVAVKVIAGASLEKNPEVVSRFQREAMASGAIESQYIAQVLDTGVDPATGSPYTVMELLVGEDVEQAIHRLGPLSPDLALRIMAQACLGLKKAHESGVVHRDIKPANLFLAKREDGDVIVKLLDFGIAKVKIDQLASGEGVGLTRTGAMLGSPLYMSPEQARGKKDLDHRTDIWSLGVVFYEALAGTTPHGHVDTLGELILQICSTPPRLVQEIAPWVPASVAGIVHKALALDPAHRFASTSDMLAAIRAELPSGNHVTEAMFVPLSQATRGAALPKFELTSGIRAPAASYAGVGPMTAQSGDNVGSTMTGVANTRDDKKGGAPMRVVVPVALALAAVAGLGAWRLASGTPSSEVSSAAPVTATPPAPVESSVPVKAVPAAVETPAPATAPAHAEEGPSPAKVAPTPSASALPVPTAAARPRVARPAAAAPPSKAPAGGMHMDMK